jgi:hypothetical protein
MERQQRRIPLIPALIPQRVEVLSQDEEDGKPQAERSFAA